MCVICVQFRPFETDHCAYSGPGATLYEAEDAPDDISTPYTIVPGDNFIGAIDPASDRDWVRIDLEAGAIYDIGLYGQGAGLGTLYDPYLRLRDAVGTQIAQDDRSGPGNDSFLTFVPPTTGTYYLDAGSFLGVYSGSYQLTVTYQGSGEPGTLDMLADYLTHGYWADNGVPARRWDTSASTEITVALNTLNAEGRQLARWALEAWEMVADLTFTEVEGEADISFGDDDDGAYALTTYSPSTGFIISSHVNVSADWIGSGGAALDSFVFGTYIHEIGHAVGLGHLGPYDGSASYPEDAIFLNDSHQLSVMSYFNQIQNTSTTASFAHVGTAMMADIVAIQNLYGAPDWTSVTGGNTVYGANSTVGGFLEALFDLLLEGPGAGAEPVALTLYDRGGNDTIDLSGTTLDNRLDLRPASFSDIQGGIGNLGIARGTTIENAVAGSGNDTIIGNWADNRLVGGTGDNRLVGGTGNDTLIGTAGNNLLEGTAGDNRLWGGTGNDTILGGTGDDRIGAGAGDNQIWAGAGNDTIWGGTGNDTIGGGAGDDLIYGTAGNNQLWGGPGNDTIFGGDGDNLIGGGAGNDRLWGGAGHDTIYGGSGDDMIGGGGGHDEIWGGPGNDTIWGGAGNDTIAGGPGTDQLWGGPGADSFVFYRSNGWNTIHDFAAEDGDMLLLAAGLWSATHGPLTPGEVVDTFGYVSAWNNAVLDFGPAGTAIALRGIDTLDGLYLQIEIA